MTTMTLARMDERMRRTSAIASMLAGSIAITQVTAVDAFARVSAPDPGKSGEDEAAAEQRKTEGLRLYEDGSTKYDAADYAGAVESFKASFDLLGDSRLLYNIAVCYDRLDRFDEALEYFARYRAVADPSEHEEVDRKVASLEKRRDAAAGGAPAPSPSTQGNGSTADPAHGSSGAAGGDAKPKVFGPAAWGLMGGAIVGLGLGLGFGLASLGQDRKARDGCPDVDGERVCNEAGSEALAKGRTYGIVADVSLGVGGALAVATIVVLIVNGTRRKKANAATQARVVPTFTGLAGRF